jgi:catalase
MDELLPVSSDALRAFDDLSGPQPGYRPTHAKGILITGSFEPSCTAQSLTRAPHIVSDCTAVTVRFSDFGGIPTVADNSDNASPRGMAIRFHLAEHVHTDILGHSVDGFPARTAEEFIEFLRALYAGRQSVEKPSPIELFLGSHPVALEFVQIPKPFPVSFAKESFYAVNAYKFVNKDGVERYGRYRIRPDGPGKYLDKAAAKSKSPNFLFDDIRQRVSNAPVKMHIFVQLAAVGDVVDNSTIRWPENRPEVFFGTLELTGVAPNNTEEQRHIIFDPIPRVDGIEPSADPLLEARAEIYLMSGRRRRAAGSEVMMNCAFISGSEEHPVVVLGTRRRPKAAVGELLIRVRAAGVTSAELHWQPNWQLKSGEKRASAVPSHEFSGVIVDSGQEVFGMNDWYSDGAMAEYCVAPVSTVTAKPKSLSDAEAASVPISALTAWQGLFDHGKLTAGESVLVHGGAGSVGIFAVQLARLHGARVFATASAKNVDYVRSLGAEQVLDYHASRFEDVVKQVDLVFDTVGGETLDRSWSVLAPGGRLVTVSTAATSSDARAKDAFFIVTPNQAQLMEVGKLLDTGKIRTEVDAVVPFSRASDAYGRTMARRGRGKVVVTISEGGESK